MRNGARSCGKRVSPYTRYPRSVLGAFLKKAKKQLLIYDPNIADRTMLRILQERAKAGVEIKVIGKVAGKASFQVEELAGIRLHTRTIIRDRSQAFVGSPSGSSRFGR